MAEREASKPQDEIEVTDEAVELPTREALSLIDVGGSGTPIPEPSDPSVPPGKLPTPASEGV